MKKIALYLGLVFLAVGCARHDPVGPPKTFYVECLAIRDCFFEAEEICGKDFEIRPFPVSLLGNLLLTTVIVECQE